METEQPLLPKGFFIQSDQNNHYNKVIYSSLNSFESKRSSRGLSVKYVHRGNENYYLGDKRYAVNAGQFLLVNHQQEVATAVHSRVAVEGICLYFDPEMVSDCKRNAQLNHQSLLDSPVPDGRFTEIAERILPLRHSALMPHISNLIEQLPIAQKSTEPYLFYEMLEALFAFELNLCNAQQRISASRKATRQELYERLLIAREFMLDNLEKKILIKDISRAAALSEFHFLRTFREVFGLPPNQFLIQHRIERAKQLLKKTKQPIISIAIECGFNDSQYFSRTFRRYTERSPSEFRRGE